MRILCALGLGAYWLVHPGAVQHLVRVAALVVHLVVRSAFAGDHAAPAPLVGVRAPLAGSVAVQPHPSGSHWH
jgi:hypothetical protein